MVDGRRGERELRRFILIAQRWRSQVNCAQEHRSQGHCAQVDRSKDHRAQKHCSEKAGCKPREIVASERSQIVVDALERCSEEAAPFDRAPFDIAFAQHERPREQGRWRNDGRRSGRERLGRPIFELQARKPRVEATSTRKR
jgi:hypothetical protein